MTVEFEWGTPPEARGSRTSFYESLAQALRERPGEWAVAERGMTAYRTQAAVFGNRIKEGKLVPFRPAGEFEARSEKGGTVWVRWIGPNGEYGDKPPAPEVVQFADANGTVIT